MLSNKLLGCSARPHAHDLIFVMALERLADRFSVRVGVELDETGRPVLDAEADEQVRAECEAVHWLFGDAHLAAPQDSAGGAGSNKGKLFITTR